MPERPLTAVLLPRPDAARAVTACWDAGEAVCVLDPAAPAEATTRLLDQLAPTHVLDRDGRHRRAGGQPVPAGTAAVVVTSGTTGTPKLVQLTEAGATSIGRGFGRALGVEPDDRALVCVPLHHVAGLAILARARVTRTPVIVHPSFDVGAVAAAPADEGATLVSLVPTMLARLLAADAPLHAFRTLVLGGAPLPPVLRERASERGARVVDAYGLSETWGGVVLDGTPLEDAEVVLDTNDDGSTKPGEILVRGPMVMSGYRDDPDATAAALTDGWLRTGDLGTIDDDGTLRVVDRLKDIILTGGVNVSPTAVEAVLARAPGVRDVCVAGVPDPEWGERVVAFVVPDPADPPTLDGLRAFAGEQLTRAQLPRELVLVEAIPRTPGGKPLRRVLRASA